MHRHIVTGVIASVIAFAPAVAHAQWDPEVPMTATGGDIFGNGIASAGSNVHLVYQVGGVTYRRSTDEGKTWANGKVIDDGILHLTDPVIADGNDVWVLTLKDIQNKSDWCCSRELGNIYLLHSGDGGDNWDAPKKLTTGQGAFRVSMAYAAGRLHVVWMDYRSNVWDTLYLRSSDRGKTWDAEKKIAASAGTFGAERPQIAARGDSVHVTIWDDRGTNPPCMAGATFSFTKCPDTFHLRSTDGGSNWSSIVNVANSGAAFAGRNDVAVAGKSSVVINFNRAAENTNDANPHLFVVRSTDDGATWGMPLQLTNTPGTSDHGSIIGAGSSVHLVWHDSRDGKLAIYYVYSTDDGATWKPDERVSTTTTAESSTPLNAVTPGFVHVTWLDKRSGSNQIYYRRRTAPIADVVPDGGAPANDGGASSGSGDAGSPSSSGAATNPTSIADSSDGCACRSSVTRRTVAWPLLIATMGIVATWMRRRRRPSS